MTDKRKHTPNESFVADIDKTTLTDISEIKIDTTKPVEERIESFIEKTKNPYCLIIDGCIVKTTFSNNDVSITERLSNGLLNNKNAGNK